MRAPEEDPPDASGASIIRPEAVADAGPGSSTTIPGNMTGTGGAGIVGSAPEDGGAGGSAGTASGGAGGGPATAGAGGPTCPPGGVLDCSSSGALSLANGQITDFSDRDWDSMTGQFCGAGGLRGRLFSFGGPGSSSGTASVDTAAQNLKLNVMVTSWAGGGVVFESCVNATSFASVRFTATLSAGSLSGCTWQVQLQTQDQRASTDVDPIGGTCTSNCYGYPAAVLAPPGAMQTAYDVPFRLFGTPSGSNVPTESQVVGVQWQVTSASPEGCSAELHLDNIGFQ